MRSHPRTAEIMGCIRDANAATERERMYALLDAARCGIEALEEECAYAGLCSDLLREVLVPDGTGDTSDTRLVYAPLLRRIRAALEKNPNAVANAGSPGSGQPPAADNRAALGPQEAEADSADFEAGTWTFRMQPGFRVAAGRYLITPMREGSEIDPSSCLCCGRVGTPKVWHAEQPRIYVCDFCKNAADRARHKLELADAEEAAYCPHGFLVGCPTCTGTAPSQVPVRGSFKCTRCGATEPPTNCPTPGCSV